MVRRGVSFVAVCRRAVARGAPALLAATLAVAMTWPLVLNVGSDIPKDLGDPLLQTWQVAWIGHAVLHQPLDLFQANVYWPLSDTLAFTDALVGYAPAGLLAQRGPHAALVTYNLLFLFAYTLAFLGAYLLARELGAGRAGGIAAGAAFAYAPWRLAQNGHLQVLSSGGIPLALFLLLRGYRRRSPRLVLCGWLVAAWQMTLGFTLGLQLAYLLAVLAAIVLVARVSGYVGAVSRGVAVATAAGVLVLVLVTFMQARPYLRVIDDHPEAERSPAHVESFSPEPRSFLAAPAQSLVWGDASFRARATLPAPDEQTLFPGLTVVLLALIGLAGSVYSRRLRVGLALAVAVCAVLSLGLRDVSGPGKYLTPYRVLYDLAPGWDGVRTPGRLTTLTSLGLALLAGAGLCVVARYVRRRAASLPGHGARAAAAGVSTLLVGAILVEGLGPIEHPSVPEAPPGQRLAVPPQLHLPWESVDFRHIYWSTAGFPPIVNGAGAFDPESMYKLRLPVESFPDGPSVSALRRLGVRTVVLHPDQVVGTPWEHAARKPVLQLPLVRDTVGGVILYRLRPLSPRDET